MTDPIYNVVNTTRSLVNNLENRLSQLEIMQDRINQLENRLDLVDKKTDFVNINSLQINDGGSINIGSSSDIKNTKCITMKFKAGETNNKIGLVVAIKTSDEGDEAVVHSDLSESEDGTRKIIGVTAEEMVEGKDVTVCIGGIFEAIVADEEKINIGDILQPSESGYVRHGDESGGGSGNGSIGNALSSGEGNADGTVKVYGIFKIQEAY